MLDKVRPPRRKDLMIAWEKLMQSKLKRRVPLNSTQALQCRRLLEYLAETSSSSGLPTKSLPLTHIAMARQVMLEIEPHERSQNHLDLARALHSVSISGQYRSCSAAPERQWRYLVRSLSLYGASQEAVQMLYSKWDDAAYAACFDTQTGLVEAVARGLAREGKEKDLLALVKYAKGHGVPYDCGVQAVMVPFYAARDRVPETKHWLAESTGQSLFRAEVYRSIASFAMRNGLQSWATQHLLRLGESRPPKRYWDVLLQAVILVGKGLGEVNELMSHMVSRDGALSPDGDTLNGLLRVAVEMRDPTLASDILALGAEEGLAPDGETHLILLQMCLAMGNLVGAQDAYQQVKHSEVWRSESRPELLDEYEQLLNEYLALLSRQAPPDFPLIVTLIEAVEEDRILLQPETVAALCLRFLENDQHFDVMDILSAHSFLFSEAQREVVQNAFITFCLDRNTSTRRAWDAYQLLNQFFQDTSFERRTRLMEAFFDRRRPDMASMVFGHMRQHRNQSFHPQLDTYVRCLEGLAQHPDRKGLGLVHNMFKMDTTVQPTTKLYTAMMLAYAACDQPLAALDFWTEITRSREGPSYASLEAVFWTLERKPGGCKKAREIWERIEKVDLEVPPAVYNAYVGAIAGSGELNDTQQAIMNMESVLGSEPDKMTLAIAHNALPGQKLQEEFREWAKDQYHEAWTELNKVGRRLNEYSLCQFKIKRVIKA
ncbi:complex I intermediate-associated protein 84 [Hirsutella rhossiliensis]|uniref:Complex I intermediate-associated protein 84 n=1 Tax=Hirsutella rhossiliensis TaxID=111463 RepID=A0A9P8SEH3_9HYPO|nr:complex I intermediate-associated protein 84 [Hirsutella rhossiliensis]KAH0959671.1 complex I intermediate-associated protein 84 [Hirsutella rhossiliensis]